MPLLDGAMKRPVGSVAMRPEILSQEAKMWWLLVEVGGKSVGVSMSGSSRFPGLVMEKAMGLLLERVERWLRRVWSRWPLYIGMDCGGYWRMSVEVRSGQVAKWPASTAFIHVESVGEKQQAW